MSEILSVLSQALGGRTTDDLSKSIGADPSSTKNALAAALPLLLAGLAKNASQPEGANALSGALSRDHDGSALDNLSGLLGNPASGNGAGILGHVLGDRQPQSQQVVAKAGGIDPATAGKLLVIAAPLVMAALGRMQRQKGLDANGLTSYLGGEKQAVANAQPGIMGMATQLLDANHDGNVVDDLTGMVGKLFSGR
jgi:hypothetical protein